MRLVSSCGGYPAVLPQGSLLTKIVKSDMLFAEGIMTDSEESSLVKELKEDLSGILKALKVRKMPADKKREAVNRVIELYSLLGIEQSEEDKEITIEIASMG